MSPIDKYVGNIVERLTSDNVELPENSSIITFLDEVTRFRMVKWVEVQQVKKLRCSYMK